MRATLGYLTWIAVAFFVLAGPVIIVLAGFLFVFFGPLFLVLFAGVGVVMELYDRAKRRLQHH